MGFRYLNMLFDPIKVITMAKLAQKETQITTSKSEEIRKVKLKLITIFSSN